MQHSVAYDAMKSVTGIEDLLQHRMGAAPEFLSSQTLHAQVEAIYQMPDFAGMQGQQTDRPV